MKVDFLSLKSGRDFLNRLFILLLILQPASLPYHHRVSAILLVLLIIFWLLTCDYKAVCHSFKNPIVILFLSLAILSVVSLLYSENKDISILEKRASLLFFPVILSSSTLSRRNVQQVLYCFVLSCTIASAYISVCTLLRNEAFHTEMAIQNVGVTHVYLGLFLSFAIVIIAYLLVTKEKHSFQSILMIFQMIFLLFFIFALGGKMSIISLILVSLAVCVVLVVKAKRLALGLLLLLAPIITFLITINAVDVAKSRFASLLNPENYFVGDNAWNSIGVRVSISKCSYEVYKQTPAIWGTGIGDVQDDLNKCYEASGFPSVRSMNTHNQYIQVFLGMGFIGLGIFLVAVCYPALKAYKQSNFLYLLFISLFLLCSITESLLERQQGIIFFAFFNSLLFFHNSEKHVDN